MRSNTPLLTDASRLSSEQNADNYSAGVAAHINGDWSGHIQIAIIPNNWADSGGNVIPRSHRLRFLATYGTNTVALVIPVVPLSQTATVPTSGTNVVSPVTGGGPQIITQPVSQSGISGGSSVQFSVVATGSGLQYQWWYGKPVIGGEQRSKIVGAISATLVLTNVGPGASGDYYCVVSNSYGSVASSQATLSVNR
jgi:hypothetical protein